MVTRTLQVLAGLAAVGAVLAVVFVVSFRTKFAPVQDRIRHVNRRFTNPRVLSKDAGRPGAYASVVNHHGRHSGAPYRTPVVVQPAGDGTYVVALPYGPGADWVRNVLAAGSATIQHEGRTIAVNRPGLVTAEVGNPHFLPKDQRAHRRFGVSDFLVLHMANAA